MAGKYLVDTNIVIAIFSGDPSLTERIRYPTELFLSVVVLGELHYGAAHSRKAASNYAQIEAFARICTLVGVDNKTAVHYGDLKASLRQKGRPIPENDLWIAASAQQHGLSVATRDRHFSHVDGIAIENW